ncbi:MAG TPA: polysaccharide biosynthesis tyrosine autokinase, partial [Terriglobales bacterium]|nr:polysaccharide biosynthesis tyrosine autokinase [Terriglobales bacterium]
MSSDKLLETKGELVVSNNPIHAGAARASLEYSAVTEDQTLKKYWLVLQKRRWTVILTLVMVMTIAAIASYKQKPLYAGVSHIAIGRENPDPLGFRNGADSSSTDDWDYNIALETQLRIIESDDVLATVIQRLHLADNPAFYVRKKPAAKQADGQPQEVDEREEAALLQAFHSALTVKIVPRTRIIEILFLSPDPRLSAEVANTIANTYMEHNFKAKFESTMQTSDWLSKQLSDLQLRVETAQEKLVRYQKDNGIIGGDDKENVVTVKLNDINKQLTDAEGDRIQKEATYHLAESGDPGLSAKAGPESLFEKLRARRAELSTQYAQLSTQFGASYPKVAEIANQMKDIDSALQSERQKIRGQLKSDYQAALQREVLLRKSFEQQKLEANGLSERAIEYNLLKRDVDTSRQLYEGLLQKLKEAGVSAGLRSSNVQVVDVARVPVVPSKPNIPRNMELAFLLGLCGGVGLAFALEALDSTVRTAEEAQMISALPTLGVVPLDVESGANPARALRKRLATSRENSSERPKQLITVKRPNSEIAEAYKALRTSILLSSAGAAPKIIMVTSALPKEGKTMTSVNTAMTLSQRGSKVLLIDADLRRPSVHNVFGARPIAGLSTLLTGSNSFEESVLPPEYPNLTVLPAGPIPPQPAELLGSNRMFELLEQWRHEYDHVVIDTPPVLSVTDAVILSVRVDSVLLVIRSAQTTKSAMRRARNILLQVNARLSGVVLNGIDLRS